VSGDLNLLPVERLTAVHRLVLSYWTQRKGERPVPRWSDFEPADVGAALPNLMLWEPDGGGSYRCRLSGSAVEERLGYALKGLSLDRLPCTHVDETTRDFDLVRERGLLSYTERTMAWADLPLTAYRHLLLPLLGSDGTVDRLLGVVTFDRLCPEDLLWDRGRRCVGEPPPLAGGLDRARRQT
jgi:hypothetical protein